MAEVDYGQLELASQLLRRQGDVHATKMSSYVRAECSLSSGDMGAVLRLFHPLNMVAVELGDRAFGLVGSLGKGSADAVDACLESYIAADRESFEFFSAMTSKLGGTPSKFDDPSGSGGTLGGAGSAADSSYGEGEPSAFEQIAGMPGDVGDIASGLYNDSVALGEGWAAGSSSVSERSDVSSYLVPPVTMTSEMDSLRWSAGPLLGGIDWIVEKLCGFSVLEDVIMKPLAGNWEEIDKASIAWGHLSKGLTEMGSNYTGLPGMTTQSWTGATAELFRAAMAAMGSAIAGLSYATDYVSGLVGTVATVSRLAASGIGAILNALSVKLLRIASAAALPVVGWLAAGLDAAVLVTQIFKWVKRIYALINLIVDAVSDFIDARGKLVDAAFIIEDLVEYVVRGAGRAVTA
jgi:hypothetical protein